jgi:hypothetical protein
MVSTLRPIALRSRDLVGRIAISGGLERNEESLFALASKPSNRWVAVRCCHSSTWTGGDGRPTLSCLDLIDLPAVCADPKPLLGFSGQRRMAEAMEQLAAMGTKEGQTQASGRSTRSSPRTQSRPLKKEPRDDERRAGGIGAAAGT